MHCRGSYIEIERGGFFLKNFKERTRLGGNLATNCLTHLKMIDENEDDPDFGFNQPQQSIVTTMMRDTIICSTAGI